MNKIEVLKQGNQVTNQLRDELVNLFAMTDTEDPYLLSKRADTIKSEIEQRFSKYISNNQSIDGTLCFLNKNQIVNSLLFLLKNSHLN